MGSHDAQPLHAAANTPDYRAELALVDRVTSLEELRRALSRPAAISSLKLGVRLVGLGLIAQHELDRALELQRARTDRHLGEILLELGLVSAEHVQQLLCDQLGIPLIELAQFVPHDAALRLVPQTLAQECCVLPICCLDGRLVVAVCDPFDTVSLDRVRFVVQMPVVPVVARRDALVQAIQTGYSATGIAYTDPRTQLATPQTQTRFDHHGARVNPLDASVVRFVSRMIDDAYAANASDIHLDASSGSENVTVRFRHDGQLIEYLQIPRHLQRAVVARIKAMAGIDRGATARAREGRIRRLEHGPADLQLRVISLPTLDGREHIAVKLVPTAKPRSLDMMGLSETLWDEARRLVARPQGLMLVSGPANSGKTTTANALLNLVDVSGTKIWTAERPGEPMRTGTSQVEVNEDIGWDFPSVMKAIVRADPDVILLGEMHDRETGGLAVQAALRGCRVIAVVEGGSAAEALSGLIDTGLEPYSLSDALLGAMSQRLVRRLCPACRVGRPLTAAGIEALSHEYCEGTDLETYAVRAQWTARFGAELRTYGAVGCEVCHGSGYQGRIGIFELLRGGAAVRTLMRRRRPASEIAAAAMRQGMLTLKQDAIEKALAGLCDLYEVRAATV